MTSNLVSGQTLGNYNFQSKGNGSRDNSKENISDDEDSERIRKEKVKWKHMKDEE